MQELARRIVIFQDFVIRKVVLEDSCKTKGLLARYWKIAIRNAQGLSISQNSFLKIILIMLKKNADTTTMNYYYQFIYKVFVRMIHPII